MKSLSLVRASSQYASAADSVSLSVTAALTIETWVYFTSLPSGVLEIRGINGKLAASAGQVFPWQLYIVNAGGGNVRIEGQVIKDTTASDAANAASVAQTLLVNTWYHVAFVFDPSTTPRCRIYLNGTELTYLTRTGTTTTIWDSTGDVLVGAIQVSTVVTPADFWDGYLFNMRIWSVVRTQSEINNNKCTIIDSATNLVASWTLNDTYLDGSGNTNTLTPVNSPVFVGSTPVCYGDFVPQIINFI